MSFRKVFLKNVFVVGGYTYLSQLINFFASFITSRILLPADFGLIGLITVFSGFITIFSDSGITMAVIRSDYKNTYYCGLNAVSIVTGIILCGITLLLIYPVSLLYNNSKIIAPFIAIAFLFILRSVSIVPLAVLQKKIQFARVGKIVFYATVITTISTIYFAYAGFKYWSLVWSQYINAIITYALLYQTTDVKISLVRKPVFVKSFNLARRLIGSLMGFNAINYWARNADNLIVGKFYGTSDLGIYNRAYLMLQLPLNLITGLFNSVLFPSLVKYKNEGGDVEKEYLFILKIISVINVPIGVILILFPETFVSILWGDNWLQVAALLPYFGLLVMVQTLLSTLGSILVLYNKERLMMVTGWIGAVFMVSGIIIGSTISIVSIAAFYALAYIVLVLPVYIFYVLRYKLNFNYNMLSFWLFKLILSVIIWIGIFGSYFYLVTGGLIAWIFVIILDTRTGLYKLLQYSKSFKPVR